MFTMITPSQGDRILQTTIGDSNSSLWFGIYIPQLKNVLRRGLKPHSWGRDRFNNSNCVHLNLEGTLLLKSAITNLPIKDGPLVYTAPDFSSRKSLLKLYDVGAFPCSDVVHLRTHAYRSVTYYQYYVPNGWQKVEVSLEFDSKSESHYRIIRRFRLSWVSSGKTVDSHSSVEWVQISYLDGIRYRRVQMNGVYNLRYPMYPSAPYGSSYQPQSKVLNAVASSFSMPSNRDIYHRLEKWRDEVQQNDLSSFGSLSIDAVQALKVFDGQLSLLLRDLMGLKGTIVSFWNGITSLTLKGSSTAYLSYRYGLKLTYSDLSSLFGNFRSVEDGIKGYNTSRSRLQRSSVTRCYPNLQTSYDYAMKLYVRHYPDWVIDALNKMMIADFFPTLELVWDIIPFSFVVDWFVGVGDYLEMLDSNTLLSTYHVLSCVYSRKATMKCKFEDIFPEYAGLVYGEWNISYYTRHVSHTPPPFSLDYSTPKSFKHWLEGAALIAQRSRV